MSLVAIIKCCRTICCLEADGRDCFNDVLFRCRPRVRWICASRSLVVVPNTMHTLTLAVTIVLGLAAFTPVWLGVSVSGQEVRLVGRWRVEYSFSEGAKSALQFDAHESGKGAFVSLDTNRSNLSPPVPGDAVWTQTSDRVSFSGEIAVPIGNVGYQMVKLKFEGKFKSARVITGEVTSVSEKEESKSAERVKGTFTATRIEGKGPQKVQNTGEPYVPQLTGGLHHETQRSPDHAERQPRGARCVLDASPDADVRARGRSAALAV